MPRTRNEWKGLCKDLTYTLPINYIILFLVIVRGLCVRLRARSILEFPFNMLS